MVIFPKAKINIGLRITGKRADGFHNIETIFYPVCLCDAIEFVVPEIPVSDDNLIVTGIFNDADPSNNLVLRAVRKLREINNFPYLNLHLHKAIPVGAGLGGGSSDAANMLKALNRYFSLGMTIERLKEISLELGSDCPFFIDSCPAFAEGRGELLKRLKPLSPQLHLLLLNPGIHVNTGEAYSLCKPEPPVTNLTELYNSEIAEWKNQIINDFEVSIFRKYPHIAELKDRIYGMGALYSSMSGSGSTVYGIFTGKPQIPESVREMVVYSDSL